MPNLVFLECTSSFQKQRKYPSQPIHLDLLALSTMCTLQNQSLLALLPLKKIPLLNFPIKRIRSEQTASIGGRSRVINPHIRFDDQWAMLVAIGPRLHRERNRL